jgi:hypothetical protein
MLRSLALAAGAAATAVCLVPGTAYADTAARGSGGQKLTVNKSSGLARAGETVTVTGSGYDVNKGIYVAFCVDNGAGAVPTPCGGGADTTGSLGASHWISSNPPSYGEGLAVPYGAGGSFRVQIKVTPKIGDIDCTKRRCAVVTRNDHTRSGDRSQDVRIPVTFAAVAVPPKTTAAAPPRTTPAAPSPTAPAPVPSTSAPAVAPATTGGPAPTSAAPTVEVTRVSESSSVGRWWTGTVVALLAALAVLLGLRAWRRRTGS